jgi:membrane fusion protein (multidrug efflux system)
VTLGRVFTAVAVFAAVVVAVAWLSGWFETKIAPGEQATGAPSLPANTETATVEVVTGLATEWASGTIESAHRTTVASRLLARVLEVHVTAGDEVAVGDALVTLDSRDLEARVRQAGEALRAAQAQRELAQAELERTQELLNRGVATRQKFDQATAALRVAAANVDRLSRALDEARTSLSYAEIRAPAAGRVVDRLVEPGDTVSPGQAVLRLYDPGALRVEAPVRESLAIDLEVGDRLEVEIDAVGQTVSGTIEEIVPYAEPGARALLVKSRLPDDSRLFAGMFARIAVPAGEESRLVIPKSAVTRIGQLEFVTVLSEEGAPSRRMITTGERLKDLRVEVLSGLKAGERLVVVAAE